MFFLAGFGDGMVTRCDWVGVNKAHYELYHDTEWGVAVHDDRHRFEMLILEGAQAGLSWETILLRRESYRTAFHHFDPNKVANMTDDELENLMLDSGIIRNRRKIWSARQNAIAYLKIQQEFGSFDAYVWQFVDGKPIINKPKSMADIQSTSPESIVLSKDLKKRGMNFVGPTIIYAYMQATGMVNDHLQTCYLCPDKS